MTFAARESSRHTGQPIDLYEFRYGPEADSVVRHTNIAQGYSFGGNLFSPLPIMRGDVVASGNLDNTTMRITMPEDSFIAGLYNGEPPSNVITLIIRQGHLADADFKVVWSGKLLNGSFNESNEIELDCEPISSSLRRSGLTQDYQYACPHVLYGPMCRASRPAATITVVVTTVDGPVLTLPTGWATEARRSKYLGGIAEWTNAAGRAERRGIVRVGGAQTLVLSSESSGLVNGMTVSLVLGCNHQHGMSDLDGDCLNLHNNLLNFGGEWEIPSKNPVGIVNNYY